MLGMHFFALSAESDPEARACAAQAMPNIVHIDAVEKLQVRDLRDFIKRRRLRGILLGGGSPCQGNSSLNSARPGLSDPRSQQPFLLAQLTRALSTDPGLVEVEVVSFLENVGSMPVSVRQQYDQWMQSSPIRINAATCGWVQRNRLYWLCSRRGGLEANLQPPESWTWSTAVTTPDSPPGLQYCGQKPVPQRVQWEDGFYPMLDPLQVLQQQGKGAIHTFTREFYHLGDKLSQVSPHAGERFLADSRRFPPGAYEERSLVWKTDAWHPLEPSERGQIMGLPVAAASAVQGGPDQRRAKQNSLIGNGFHIPSILVLLMLMPQLLEAKMTKQPVSPDFDLRDRLRNTVWAPGRLDSMSGMLSPMDIVKEMQLMLPFEQLQPLLWQDTFGRLGMCNLTQLQACTAWRRLRGESLQLLGPTPLGGRERSLIFAGLSGQRYAAASARGLDHLLPPGLGPELHMAQSAKLPSPFCPRPWPEPDVLFVIEAAMPSLSAKLRHILKTVAVALAPLEEALSALRSKAASQVAATKTPAFVACLTALLRWPDRAQPKHILQGYPIVGPVDPCGVFREMRQTDKDDLSTWLGPPAEADLHRLVTSKAPLHADTILQITQE